MLNQVVRYRRRRSVIAIGKPKDLGPIRVRESWIRDYWRDHGQACLLVDRRGAERNVTVVMADDCEQLSIAGERLRALQTLVLASFVIESTGVHARALYSSAGVRLVDAIWMACAISRPRLAPRPDRGTPMPNLIFLPSSGVCEVSDAMTYSSFSCDLCWSLITGYRFQAAAASSRAFGVSWILLST